MGAGPDGGGLSRGFPGFLPEVFPATPPAAGVDVDLSGGLGAQVEEALGERGAHRQQPVECGQRPENVAVGPGGTGDPGLVEAVYVHQFVEGPDGGSVEMPGRCPVTVIGENADHPTLGEFDVPGLIAEQQGQAVVPAAQVRQ